MAPRSAGKPVKGSAEDERALGSVAPLAVTTAPSTWAGVDGDELCTAVDEPDVAQGAVVVVTAGAVVEVVDVELVEDVVDVLAVVEVVEVGVAAHRFVAPLTVVVVVARTVVEVVDVDVDEVDDVDVDVDEVGDVEVVVVVDDAATPAVVVQVNPFGSLPIPDVVTFVKVTWAPQ
jgi:hypothetical protein